MSKENGAINPDMSSSDYLSLLEHSNNGRLDQRSIRQLLHAKLPAEGQPSRDQIRDIIAAVSQPQRLSRIAESILTNPDQLQQTASRSFGHSTGMERIELASQGEFSLRVHFWMPGNEEPMTEDPHSHVYNFGSRVISGVLVTDLFMPGEEGVKINEYQITTQNSKDKPKPVLQGETRIQPITPPQGIVLFEGSPTYTMSHDVIHRIRQGDLEIPIITLNLRGGNVKDKSTFYRDDTMPNANPIPTQVDVENRLGLLRYRLSSEI